VRQRNADDALCEEERDGRLVAARHRDVQRAEVALQARVGQAVVVGQQAVQLRAASVRKGGDNEKRRGVSERTQRAARRGAARRRRGARAPRARVTPRGWRAGAPRQRACGARRARSLGR
jgi:hypothetical protein